MDPEDSPGDDLDVSLQWPDAGPAGAVADEPGLDRLVRGRSVLSAENPGVSNKSTPPDLDSLVSTVDSMRAVVEQLVRAVASMQRRLEAAASKIDDLETRRRRSAGGDDVGAQLAELTKQIEALRKRVSLRARSEQLAAETAEHIASAVIDGLADVIPEAGQRLRSRRRTARS